MSKQAIKIYTLEDFLTMQPGTLLGGLANLAAPCGPPARYQFASEWCCGLDKERVTVLVYVEATVKFRELLPTTKPIPNSDVTLHVTPDMDVASTVHFRPLHEQSSVQRAALGPSWIRYKFDVGKIVGMYLGSVLWSKKDGITYINFLSPDGRDLWL